MVGMKWWIWVYKGNWKSIYRPYRYMCLKSVELLTNTHAISIPGVILVFSHPPSCQAFIFVLNLYI